MLFGKKGLRQRIYSWINYLKDIEIHYADGSVYQVYSEDEHVDNTSNLCGTEGSEILLIFNRLVDPENMESIAINGVTYTAVAE